ncbi:MAG: UvrD-helicase domain-containing protein, partial [Acholeplasmataceae bacterium]|nr:UvrD-helicase domain-containing protein [Acholeplasmataceae bacterium]
MIDLTLLNKEQSKAVTHINGPVSVIAGAGSGKTKTLTYRIAYMITEGIDPQSIVAVTFTNKAAAEMKERVMNLVGEKGYLTQISTFHAFCSRFLRNEITNLNQGYTRRFLIIDEDDSKQIIRDTVKELNYDSNKYSSNRLKNLFSKIKNGQYDFLDFDETKIFNAYNQYLKDNNALDFDDLILKTIEVFNRCPEVKDYYNRQYEYILV